MPTLWLFDIEAHEQRYTGEWQTYLPQQLKTAMLSHKKLWQLHVISGGQTSGTLSPGGFMNFAETNIYKARQVAEFSKLVQSGDVKHGDRLLFTDAWHPGVIHCRYMSDLLGLSLSIHVLWHAGSYDKNDELGRKITNKKWSLNFERAVFHAANRNYFATVYHRDLFMAKVNPRVAKKAHVVGWPMEYLPGLLKPYATRKKERVILFPHRMAPEKQPKILRSLKPLLPGYKIVFAQEQNLPKAQYHALLGKSVAVFSANLQESLGIGIYEGLLCGAVPIIPKRLSYSEMYPYWCYPSSWSMSRKSATNARSVLSAQIRNSILTRNPANIAKLAKKVGNRFFNGRALYASILR